MAIAYIAGVSLYAVELLLLVCLRYFLIGLLGSLFTELELADVASAWTETHSLTRSATSPLPSWGLKTGVQAVKFESGRRIGSSALSPAAVGLK